MKQSPSWTCGRTRAETNFSTTPNLCCDRLWPLKIRFVFDPAETKSVWKWKEKKWFWGRVKVEGVDCDDQSDNRGRFYGTASLVYCPRGLFLDLHCCSRPAVVSVGLHLNDFGVNDVKQAPQEGKLGRGEPSPHHTHCRSAPCQCFLLDVFSSSTG